MLFDCPRRRMRALLLCTALLLSLAGHAVVDCSLGARAGAASAGQEVYTPADPGQFAGYPRVIRLEHNGSADGDLLAAFDIFTSGHDSILLYASKDGGRAWSPHAQLDEAAYGGRMCCETLFELPLRLGTQPAGTLLLAESAGAAGDIGHAIRIFHSVDQGRHWTYFSTAASGAGGVWEPEFAIDRAGHLVCYFSDERQATYSQFLGQVASIDGGRTWGPEHADVAVPDGFSRPGMATVVRLPSGSYVMSFEVCGRSNCEVHVKTSFNGDSWGSPADLGPRVQTTRGLYAGHTPYLTWTPTGGPRGTLVLAAQDLFTPDDLEAPQSRDLLLINRRAGIGPWTPIAAPVRVSHGGPQCANYSSALLPSHSGSDLLMVAAVGLDAGGCAIEARTAQRAFISPGSAT